MISFVLRRHRRVRETSPRLHSSQSISEQARVEDLALLEQRQRNGSRRRMERHTGADAAEHAREPFGAHHLTQPVDHVAVRELRCVSRRRGKVQGAKADARSHSCRRQTRNSNKRRCATAHRRGNVLKCCVALLRCTCSRSLTTSSGLVTNEAKVPAPAPLSARAATYNRCDAEHPYHGSTCERRKHTRQSRVRHVAHAHTRVRTQREQAPESTQSTAAWLTIGRTRGRAGLRQKVSPS